MSAAFEVPADDPQTVAEAITRAASGEGVHLVRDGQSVADVVPAKPRGQISEEAWATAIQRSRRMARSVRCPHARALPSGLSGAAAAVAR